MKKFVVLEPGVVVNKEEVETVYLGHGGTLNNKLIVRFFSGAITVLQTTTDIKYILEQLNG